MIVVRQILHGGGSLCDILKWCNKDLRGRVAILTEDRTEWKWFTVIHYHPWCMLTTWTKIIIIIIIADNTGLQLTLISLWQLCDKIQAKTHAVDKIKENVDRPKELEAVKTYRIRRRRPLGCLTRWLTKLNWAVRASWFTGSNLCVSAHITHALYTIIINTVN